MMRQDEDYFNEVFGDIFTEFLWIPLMNLIKNQLRLAEDYLKLPGLHTYFRSAMLNALVQVYHHCPNQKEEVMEVYKNVLRFFTNVGLEGNIIDSVFNSFLIW